MCFRIYQRLSAFKFIRETKNRNGKEKREMLYSFMVNEYSELSSNFSMRKKREHEKRRYSVRAYAKIRRENLFTFQHSVYWRTFFIFIAIVIRFVKKNIYSIFAIHITLDIAFVHSKIWIGDFDNNEQKPIG